MKRPLQLKTLIAGLAGYLAVVCAWANPTGITVAPGQGTFLQITNPATAGINWQAYSIGAGTQFIQQSAASMVLNRVTGSNPSVILGNLQSSGRVFMVNPAGAAFGTPQGLPVGNTIGAGKTIELTDPKNPGISVQVTAPTNRSVDVQQVVDAIGKRDIGSALNFGSAPRSATTVMRDETGNLVLRFAP